MSIHIDSLCGLSLPLLFHRFGLHLWLESLLTCHCWHHKSLIRHRFLGFEIFGFGKSIRDLWALDRFLKLDVDVFLLSIRIQVQSRRVPKHLSPLFILWSTADHISLNTKFVFRVV